jgi:hypothetical protein
MTIFTLRTSFNVPDGRPGGGGEGSVDGAHQLVNILLELLVLLHVGSGGHRHLRWNSWTSI